jgi:hypothetical protein
MTMLAGDLIQVMTGARVRLPQHLARDYELPFFLYRDAVDMRLILTIALSALMLSGCMTN